MPGADYRGCAFLNTLTETPEGESPLRLEIEDHKRGLLALIRGYVAAHRSQESEDEITQIARSIFILFEGALIEMQNFRDVWPAQAAKSRKCRSSRTSETDSHLRGCGVECRAIFKTPAQCPGYRRLTVVVTAVPGF